MTQPPPPPPPDALTENERQQLLLLVKARGVTGAARAIGSTIPSIDGLVSWRRRMRPSAIARIRERLAALAVAQGGNDA